MLTTDRPSNEKIYHSFLCHILSIVSTRYESNENIQHIFIARFYEVEAYFLKIIDGFLLLFSFSRNNHVFLWYGFYQECNIGQCQEVCGLMVIPQGKLRDISGFEHLPTGKSVVCHGGTAIFPIDGRFSNLVRTIREQIIPECGSKKQIFLPCLFQEGGKYGTVEFWRISVHKLGNAERYEIRLRNLACKCFGKF